MSLEFAISQLLFRYPCVTVPNFGAFISENISANFNESTYTFYPPKKIISFNSYIKNNDGLVANHLASSLKITHEQANEQIKNELLNWEIKLQNGEILILKNIGSFRKNFENNLIFEPSNHVNYLSQSFGLSAVVSPEIKREIAKKLEIEIPVVAIQNNKIEEDWYPEPRFSFQKALKYAAVLLVSLGGSAFGYSIYINQQAQQETLLIQAQVQKEIDSKLQQATFFLNTPIILNENNLENTIKPFHIMSGAFRSHENAQKELEKLQKNGFEATILKKNNQNLFPVAFQSYTSYSEANSNLQNIKKLIQKHGFL